MPKGPGEIDLTARLSRADAKQVHRYLPNVIGSDTRVWLRDSLLDGNVDDARLTLKGDLARFPFADGKAGTFILTVNALDTTLDYANGWPALSGVDAEIRLRGPSARRHRVAWDGCSVRRSAARAQRSPTCRPSIRSLVIDGEASGPTSEFLQFIRSSPVSAWIGHFTDDASAIGNGKLALKVEMALGKPDCDAEGRGRLSVQSTTSCGFRACLRWVPSTVVSRSPSASSTVATSRWRRSAVPARVSIASRDGEVKVNADRQRQSRRRASRIRNAARGALHGPHRLAARARGAQRVRDLDARVELARRRRRPAAPARQDRVRSDAAQGRTACAWRRTPRATRSSSTTEAWAAWSPIASSMRPARHVDRALLLLGKASQAAAAPERAGIAIRGNVDAANVDEWLAIADSRRRRAATSRRRVAGARVGGARSGRARRVRSKLRCDDAFRAPRGAAMAAALQFAPDRRHGAMGTGRLDARERTLLRAARETRLRGDARSARTPSHRGPKRRDAKDRRIRGPSSTSAPSASSRVRAISAGWSSRRDPKAPTGASAGSR